MITREDCRQCLAYLGAFADDVCSESQIVRVVDASVGVSDAEMTFEVRIGHQVLLSECIQIGDYCDSTGSLGYIPRIRLRLTSPGDVDRFLNEDLLPRILDCVKSAVEEHKRALVYAGEETATEPGHSPKLKFTDEQPSESPAAAGSLSAVTAPTWPSGKVLIFELVGTLVALPPRKSQLPKLEAGGNADLVAAHRWFDGQLSGGGVCRLVAEAAVLEIISRASPRSVVLATALPQTLADLVVYRLFPRIRWNQVVQVHSASRRVLRQHWIKSVLSDLSIDDPEDVILVSSRQKDVQSTVRVGVFAVDMRVGR